MTHTTDLDMLIARCITDPTAHLPLVDELMACDQWTWDRVQGLVREYPESDGFRLLAAEWWERLPPARVACPACAREVWEKTSHTPDKCPKCHGTGTILDTSNAARAELVRVQVEVPPVRSRQCDCSGKDDILTAHRSEWERLPCGAIGPHHGDVCSGGRVRCANAQFTEDCRVCGGSGDLLQRFVSTATSSRHLSARPVQWERGFPVVSCESGQVWRERREGYDARTSVAVGTVPTPWAREIAKWAVGLRLTDREPYPVGLRLTDREPYPVLSSGNVFAWMNGGIGSNGGDSVPTAIFDMMQGFVRGGGLAKHYPTRAAAERALTWATAKWARGFAG